jgi:hypothetical protein
MLLISSLLRKSADSSFWQDEIQKRYGIVCYSKEPGEVLDPIILRQTSNILGTMPIELVKDCGISALHFKFLGENKSYFPNHGYYNNGAVTLNTDIFYHPDDVIDFYDENYHRVSRPSQTLVHEFLHGFDAFHNELSLKPEWLNLSGWCPLPKPGLKRMVINEPGMPVKMGEWYYSPDAKFPRFYAKMNPWDDFADSGTFFIYGMKNKLPDNKNSYFEKLFKNYY